MRVLIAPDKYKGSLTAAAVAEAIRIGLERARPDIQSTLCPIADGGDGFLDAVAASTPRPLEHTLIVKDALGRDRRARFLTTGGTAYVEAAEAVSITHQPPSPNVALSADSYGVGQLIRAALDADAQCVVVGLGGTSTTDGGLGMLRALGAQPTDAQGGTIAPGGAGLTDVGHVDLNSLDPRLASVDLVAAFDVANPLLGPTGAAEVYSPQKGADADLVRRLAGGLQRLRDALLEGTGNDIDVAGGGSAGGMGASLAGGLNARMVSGAELVLEMTGIRQKLPGHDLVVTGEGSFDEQSLNGKGPHAVITAAARLHIPVAVLAGRCTLPRETTCANGITDVMTLSETYDDPFTEPYNKLCHLSAALFTTASSLGPTMNDATSQVIKHGRKGSTVGNESLWVE